MLPTLHYGAAIFSGLSLGAFLGTWRRRYCAPVWPVWLLAACGWTVAAWAIPVTP